MKRTVTLSNPPVIASYATTVGPKEGKGPMAQWFDNILTDDTLGEKSYEKAECQMFSMTADLALTRAKLAPGDVDLMFGGDLLDQLISASFTARGLEIPFLGLYGACSTMSESLIAATMALCSGSAQTVLCVTGSHFSTAERQYRFPLELGNQRPPTSQWTATATGATVLKAQGDGPRITRFTVGKVIDFGIKDGNNMGAAMAPAAADTIAAHFNDSGVAPDYYDYIVTGDLGKLGRDILHELLLQRNLSLGQRHRDCGCEMYSDDQDVDCGASGCGCAASFLNGYYLKRMSYGEIKRILLIATGALLSPTSSMQGESIPSVAHAVAIEMG